MVSKVLHSKNGVITEERFQEMTPVQWIFHYQEIVKYEKEENEIKLSLLKIISSKMDEISVTIEGIYPMLSKQFKDALNIVYDIKRKIRDKIFGNKENEETGGYSKDGVYYMSETDKELWEFMLSCPEKISPTDKMKADEKEHKFILPKGSIKEINDKEKKIKTGFHLNAKG